jgi:hypothetical protein
MTGYPKASFGRRHAEATTWRWYDQTGTAEFLRRFYQPEVFSDPTSATILEPDAMTVFAFGTMGTGKTAKLEMIVAYGLIMIAWITIESSNFIRSKYIGVMKDHVTPQRNQFVLIPDAGESVAGRYGILTGEREGIVNYWTQMRHEFRDIRLVVSPQDPSGMFFVLIDAQTFKMIDKILRTTVKFMIFTSWSIDPDEVAIMTKLLHGHPEAIARLQDISRRIETDKENREEARKKGLKMPNSPKSEAVWVSSSGDIGYLNLNDVFKYKERVPWRDVTPNPQGKYDELQGFIEEIRLKEVERLKDDPLFEDGDEFMLESCQVEDRLIQIAEEKGITIKTKDMVTIKRLYAAAKLDFQRGLLTKLEEMKQAFPGKLRELIDSGGIDLGERYMPEDLLDVIDPARRLFSSPLKFTRWVVSHRKELEANAIELKKKRDPVSWVFHNLGEGSWGSGRGAKKLEWPKILQLLNTAILDAKLVLPCEYTPDQLINKIDPDRSEYATPRKLSRAINENIKQIAEDLELSMRRSEVAPHDWIIESVAETPGIPKQRQDV